MVKNLPINAGDTGLISGSGRSPREEHGNPLQYSYQENPGAGWTTVHGVTKSWTQLSNQTTTTTILKLIPKQDIKLLYKPLPLQHLNSVLSTFKTMSMKSSTYKTQDWKTIQGTSWQPSGRIQHFHCPTLGSVPSHANCMTHQKGNKIIHPLSQFDWFGIVLSSKYDKNGIFNTWTQ